MQTWLSDSAPAPLGRAGGIDAAPVSIFDQASQTLVEVPQDRQAHTARLYTCGITPYDATHLGHARTYLTVDLLTRAWLDAGIQVISVQNVTDVDDPLLERAQQTGQDWRELAQHEVDLYRQDMAALHVLPPTQLLGVVDNVALIADFARQLRDAGATYELDGDLYLLADADPWAVRVLDEQTGSVSHLNAQQRQQIFAERGGDPQRPGKKHPLDQLLWRSRGGQAPTDPWWESPVGPGRPGWHVECAALSLHGLGRHVDVLAGGSDLAFPHHEMSQACLRALTSEDVDARAVLHVGMMGWQGEKMSKSRGNLVKVSDLRAAGVDMNALRLAIITPHYRDDHEYSDADLPQASQRLARWRRAVAQASLLPAAELPAAAGMLSRLREAMRDDLDVGAAVATVDDWVQAVLVTGSQPSTSPQKQGGAEHPAQQVSHAISALLGVSVAPEAE